MYLSTQEFVFCCKEKQYVKSRLVVNLNIYGIYKKDKSKNYVRPHIITISDVKNIIVTSSNLISKILEEKGLWPK